VSVRTFVSILFPSVFFLSLRPSFYCAHSDGVFSLVVWMVFTLARRLEVYDALDGRLGRDGMDGTGVFGVSRRYS
jgi:hypothetical protein